MTDDRAAWYKELVDDIERCSCRVSQKDAIINLVDQYQNIVLKYGHRHLDAINRAVYDEITYIVLRSLED